MKYIISIIGSNYELDMERATEQGCLKPCHAIKICDFFENPKTKEKYVLIACGPQQVALVSLSSGILLTPPVTVSNRHYITADEFYRISNGIDLNRMNNVSVIEKVAEKVDGK